MQSYKDATKEVIEQINYAKKYNAEIVRYDVLMLQPEDYKKIARATKSTVKFNAQFSGTRRAYYMVNFHNGDGGWIVTYYSPDIINTDDDFEYDGTKNDQSGDDD